MKPSTPPDSQLDRLLGDSPDLGVTEQEAMLSHILERRAPPVRRRWASWRWALAVVSLTTATVAAVLILRAPRDDEWGTRGAALRPSFFVSCLDEQGPAPCHAKAKLVFRLVPRGYEAFAAVAETPDGATVWYFPASAEGVSADARSLGPEGVLQEAVVLDGPPGTYTLHGLFTHRPLTRAQVRAALMDPSGSDAVHVSIEVKVP